MSERIIEGRWKCTSCQSWVLGRFKRCPTDGNPREDGAEMDFDFQPESAPPVTDPGLLTLANAGADKFCPYCNSGNVGTGTHCESCGADLTGIPQILKLVLITPDPVIAPYLPDPVVKPWPRHIPHVDVLAPDPWWARFTWWHYSAAIFSVLLVILLVWGFSTHVVYGTCTGKGWSRSATRETWVRVTDEDWRSNITNESPRLPINGSGEVAGSENVRGCYSKVHHYDHIQVGTRSEDYSDSESYACGESCTNNKNGFASCRTKYCSRSVTKTRRVPVYRDDPVYRSWCTYDTWKWLKGDTRVTVGTLPGGTSSEEGTPVWPRLDPGPLDRIIRTESYQIHVAYEDKIHDEILSHSGYDTWHVGDAAKVTVNNFGSVRAVQKQ